MFISVRVIPKASRNLVKLENGCYKAYLTKPARDGLANKELIELMSDYLKVKKYEIEIVKGHKTHNKLLKINV